MTRWTDAVTELYRSPLPGFVAERKRLAAALKADGHADLAKQLLGRRRPTISAWVVNQLWWHARPLFDDLLASADELRAGDMKASAAHRDAIAKLRTRAATLLKDAEHAPTESVLRRVTTTLSAIAVAGGFDPDEPGTLAEDRDPPGFAAFGLGPVPGDASAAPARPAATVPPKKNDAAERAARQAAAIAEKKRQEAEARHIAAEKHRLEAALRTAKGELHDRERAVTQLEKQLAEAGREVEKAQAIVDDLAASLATLR